MDLRIFHKKDGGIVQLVDKEQMEEWPIELPLIFIEYIRDKKIDSYGDAKVEKEISAYLDEITKDIAIPRFIGVIQGDDNDEIVLALTRIEEISRKNLDMVRPIKKYLDDLITSKIKKIKDLASKIEKNFASAERKKKLAQKRKIMRDKEKLFLEGKINGEEYALARKEYLTLKE